jgi:uncharacterized protein (DUF58 family)
MPSEGVRAVTWLLGAVLLLVVALLLGMDLLAYALYALVAVLLSSRYLAARWAQAAAAEREGSRWQVEIGQKVAILVTVENRSRWPILWLLVEDVLPPEALIHRPPRLAVDGMRMRLWMLPAGGRRTLSYQLTPTRRGYYQIGPLVAETGDLFGLHRRYRMLTRPQFLLVRPRVIPLAGYAISSRRPIGEVRMTYRLYEDPTRICGVRAYERGDPLGRIHWKATARTGLLHSKVYEPSTVAGATLLLDLHRATHPARHEPVRSELAITAAASIAHALCLAGQQVGLVTNGRDAADRIRQEGWTADARTRQEALAAATMRAASDRLAPVVVPTRRSAEQLGAILDTLARLELTDGLPLAALITETASRMPRDASVVAILPPQDPAAAIALGNLRRRGWAVTALINCFEEDEFAAAASALAAEGVEARHLQDEAAIPALCSPLGVR